MPFKAMQLRNHGGPVPAGSYDASVLADSPVAYWKCDETSGSVVADSSGNGHHLSAVFDGGATMATVSEAPRSGFTGMGRALALNLANTTQVRNLTPSPDLRLTSGPITFEFLHRRASTGYMWIFFNGAGNGGVIPCYYEVRQGAAGAVFEVKASGGTPNFTISHGITDADPHLCHLVLNSDRSSIAYYRDGSFVSNTARVGTWSAGGTGEGMWIGRRADGFTQSNWINNLALYNVALSAARIAERWALRELP